MTFSCTSDFNDDKKSAKFTNTEKEYSTSIGSLFEVMKAYWRDNRSQATPSYDVPVQQITAKQLLEDTSDAVFRLGHSTVLLRIDHDLILFDPVFSDRASPVQWMGPKRFHQPPISIADLPTIKAVIISHDHYDHLDKQAILDLNQKVEHFITPLQVGALLRKWGVSEHKITELDWWQSTQLETLTITATPSQHFSGRGLFDTNETLWASWVIAGWESKVFFSGDSGYFNGFKEIGERLGPFDLTMIETGAYNELWPDIHMFPEQSLQAHIDLKGAAMMPIHNGTFDLSLHNWYEPLQKITELAQEKEVSVLTPTFGEKVTIQTPEQNAAHWWFPLTSSR